jgi:cytochrome c553
MGRWIQFGFVKRTMTWGLLGLAAGSQLGCGVDVTPVVEDEPPQVAAKLPPISGGSLLITRDGAFAVAADADMDRVVVLSLPDGGLAAEIALEPGDEPGRLVEGADGSVHVALRRSAAIARIDIAAKSVTRRAACGAPRGIAYDASKGEIHLACAGGELLTYDADSDAPAKRTLHLGRDLRDVMVRHDGLLVSQFRSPALIRIDAAGMPQTRVTPRSFVAEQSQDFPPAGKPAVFTPTVAWRTRLLADGRAVMLHQRAMAGQVGIHPGGEQGPQAESAYGGSTLSCRSPIVHAAVSVLDPDEPSAQEEPGPIAVGGLNAAVLPVDLALSPSQDTIAVAAAGSRTVKIIPLGAVIVRDASHGCGSLGDDVQIPAQPIAVAFATNDDLIIQTRRPAAVWRFRSNGQQLDMLFRFEGVEPRNVGHDLFHNRASQNSAIACASCHPGGRDDGHVWNFEELGARRTQSLVGGLLATLPLHWDGEMQDVAQIMDEVFVDRMGGGQPHPERVAEVGAWLDTLPTLMSSSPADAGAISRGEALYHDAVVACASCHSGSQLTNNKTVAVGTGQALQVPSLVGIADRAPFMHDGCAADLTSRFDTNCGGGDAHGKTSHLSATQINDLVTYLETL